MRDVADLVDSWQGPDSALPRLTWYGPGAERVELSGRVLANWVIKVANLLTEEADAEPGTTVRLDLPPHWRALVWAVGAWLTGAQVQVGSQSAEFEADDGAAADDGPGTGGGHWDVVVTDRPHRAPAAEVLIAVALPALAMTFDSDLPAGAIDGAADLMTYADVLMLPTEAAELQEVAGPPWSGPDRVLITVAERATAEQETDLVAQVLSIWRAGAAVVLVADPQADTTRLATVEGAEQIKESGHE